jgi:hypothetical protein
MHIYIPAKKAYAHIDVTGMDAKELKPPTCSLTKKVHTHCSYMPTNGVISCACKTDRHQRQNVKKGPKLT